MEPRNGTVQVTRPRGSTLIQAKPVWSMPMTQSPTEVGSADGEYETFEEASIAASKAILELRSTGFSITQYTVKRTKLRSFRIKVRGERRAD